MCSLTESVIDRSMTILADTLVGCAVLLKIVIDRSMTIFACIRNGLSQKIVIDRSMTILAETLVGCAVLLKMSLTGQ